MSGLFGSTRPITQEAPTVSSFSPQTSCYGKPIPLLWGKNRLAPNLLWYSDLTAIAHTSSVAAGGKGADSQQLPGSTSYTYTVAVLLALCEGPVAGFGSVWQQRAAPQPLAALGLTGFPGSYTQDEFGWLLSAHAAQALKYRGIAYVAAAAYALGNSSNLPNNNIEVQGPFAFGAGSAKIFTASVADFLLSATAGILPVDTVVRLVTTGVLPAPLAAGTDYVIVTANDDGTFELSTSSGGSPIAITNAGTGSHFIESFLTPTAVAQGFTAMDYFIPAPGRPVVPVVLVEALFTSAAHGLTSNRSVRLSSTGTLPGGFAAGTDYYVRSPTANTFQLALEIGGTPVAPSSAGTGTHSVFQWIADANPKDIVEDYLSNEHYGCGFPSAKIGDLTAFSNYCVAAGIFLSPALTEQEQAHGPLVRMVQAGYSEIVYSEDQLKIVPYYEQAITGNGVTYTPNLTAIYPLTDDDFQPASGRDPVEVDRSDPADAYNAVSIEYSDRLYYYNNRPVEARNEAAIALYGYRPAPVIMLHELALSSAAIRIANLALDHIQNIRCTYRFRLPARFVALEPMDIVTLTESTGTGLSEQPVRIKEIEEDEAGYFNVIAQDIRANAAEDVLYDTELAGGYSSDFNVKPGNVTAPVIFDAPARLTPKSLEVWCALAGGANWGGAEIWVSWDQDTYERAGTFSGKSRYGKVKTALPYKKDPDVGSSFDVDLASSGGTLASGTQADCDQYRTLCWVGGELISYQSATLVSGNRYTLGTRLRRGVYSTPVKKSHAVGEGFVRLDLASGSIFRFAYDDPKRIGQTVYIKFLSFNTHGAAQKQLAEVQAYPYKIRGPIGVPPVATPRGLEIFKSATGNVFSGRDCKFVWRDDAALAWYELGSEPVGNTQSGSGPAGAGGLDSFFKDYLVEIYNVEGNNKPVRSEHITVPYYTYTWEKNAEDHAGSPVRSFAIKVYKRSVLGVRSAIPAVMIATNPAPASTALSWIMLAASPGGFKYSLAIPKGTDIAGVKIYASLYSGEVGASTQVVNRAAVNNQINAGQVTGLIAGLTYYVMFVAYDVFGDGVASLELSVTPKLIPGAPGGLGGTPGHGMIFALDGVDYGNLFDYAASKSAACYVPSTGHIMVVQIASGKLQVLAVNPQDNTLSKSVSSSVTADVVSDTVGFTTPLKAPIFSPLTGKVYCTYKNGTSSRIATINPQTLAVESTLLIESSATRTWEAVCFSPVDGKVLLGTTYTSSGNALLCFYDPATDTIGTSYDTGLSLTYITAAAYFPGADRFAWFSSLNVNAKTYFTDRALTTTATYTHVAAAFVIDVPIYVPVGSRMWVPVFMDTYCKFYLFKPDLTLDSSITMSEISNDGNLFCRGNGLVVSLSGQAGGKYSTFDPITKTEVMAGVAGESINSFIGPKAIYVPGVDLIFSGTISSSGKQYKRFVV